MAKIIAEFDTIDKSLSVTMDGQKLENVDSVSVSKAYFDRDGDGDEDEVDYYFSLCQVEPKQEEGHTVVTKIIAAQTPEGKSPQAEDLPCLPGYKKVTARKTPPTPAVQKHIADYFGVK